MNPESKSLVTETASGTVQDQVWCLECKDMRYVETLTNLQSTGGN